MLHLLNCESTASTSLVCKRTGEIVRMQHSQANSKPNIAKFHCKNVYTESCNAVSYHYSTILAGGLGPGRDNPADQTCELSNRCKFGVLHPIGYCTFPSAIPLQTSCNAVSGQQWLLVVLPLVSSARSRPWLCQTDQTCSASSSRVEYLK